MVVVGVARNWQGIRVSGHEDFKRLVWLEASLRGVRTLGYEPAPADLDLVRRERDARAVNRIEPALHETPGAPGAADKATGRGGGRKAVIVGIETVLLAQKVPQARREAILAAVAEKLPQRLSQGQQFSVKAYDRSAAPQRPVIAPSREPERTRERPAPVR
jgi:hypothetical protein